MKWLQIHRNRWTAFESDDIYYEVYREARQRWYARRVVHDEENGPQGTDLTVNGLGGYRHRRWWQTAIAAKRAVEALLERQPDGPETPPNDNGWITDAKGWTKEVNGKTLLIYSPSSNRYFGCIGDQHVRTPNGDLRRWNRLGRAMEGMERWAKDHG